MANKPLSEMNASELLDRACAREVAGSNMALKFLETAIKRDEAEHEHDRKYGTKQASLPRK